MTYKNIIFDFDGTLFDTNGVYAREYVKLGNEYGFNDTYEDAYTWLAKYSVYYAISRHDWGCRYRFVEERFRPMRNAAALADAKPMEGCEALLRYIEDNGGKMFLYTDNNSIAYDCLEKWDMKRYFSGAVFCTGEGLPLKPSPEGLLFLLQKYGLDPSDCLIVGDRDADILSGEGANVSGALLDRHNFFPEVRSKYRVTSLREIEGILKI